MKLSWWILVSLLPGTLEASEAQVLWASAGNLSPRGAAVAWALSEPAEVVVEVFSDEAGAAPASEVEVVPSPFRDSDTASHAAQRSLGWARLERLTPTTAFYYRLVVTSKSTGEVVHYPPSGLLRLETPAVQDPFAGGMWSAGPLLGVDVRPPAGTAAGGLVQLEAKGAAATLLAFVGEGQGSDQAWFDLSNLYGATSGATLPITAGTEVVVTHISDGLNVQKRGWQLGAPSGGIANLSAYSRTLSVPEGWSFFSLSLEPSDPAAEAVFGAAWAQVQELWCLDGVTWHGPLAGDEPLPLMTGCAVKVSQSLQVQLEGPRVLDTLTLAPGWNLLSLGNTTTLAVPADLEEGLGDALRAAWVFEPEGERWAVWEADWPDLADLTLLAAEVPVWLWVEELRTWEVRP